MSQDTGNNSTNFSNNTNSFNNVLNNYTFTDGQSQILTWLSPLEPRLRHRDIQERRVDSVGEWLIQTEEFKSWKEYRGEGEGDKPVMFCYGNPGVGKTFITSLVVDRLRDQARGQSAAVAYFYFDFAARKEQSATSMLGSLLKQIVRGMGVIPEDISRAFREEGMGIGGPGPRLPDIVKMLQAIASSLRLFICIDAVDECAAVHRAKILDSLKQVLEKSPHTRVFITGRPHIREESEKRLAGQVVSMSVGPRRDDIIGYLRARLGEDEIPEAMDESLEADILEKIPENMSEMFLLVSLNIDAILHESTLYRRREKLRKMTGGLELGDVYGATIGRVKAQDGDKSRLGMATLMWISHAERPLQADELCHALAVELGSTDFNASNVPSISILVSCCQGLITVDKEASTVRLIHFTLQEYLSAHPDISNRPHSAMAEICLTYLNSRQVKALSAAPPDMWNTPFIEYCSVYWGVHAKREPSESSRSLALELLQEHYSPVSTKLLLKQVPHLDIWGFNPCSPFSGLHCASFFGIVEVVAGLIEMKSYDINERDFLGCTPLAWAAHSGHEEVVKILLEQEEVDPNQLDNNGLAPLTSAVLYRHEGVVKVLLGHKKVDADGPGFYGRTPLLFAALLGHEGVVKILLEREGVNPDKLDDDGRTALSLASWNGHEATVKILLERKEVTPDRRDNYGQTPLSLAALNGHEATVKILLGRGEVNPDTPDNDGRTPLSLATDKGHSRVVALLQSRKAVTPSTIEI